MIRTLIKLGLFLVAGILVYNYFFGTPEEKETSREIFGEVRDLGAATWGLLRSEKEKFDQGKYDEALDKIGNLFADLKRNADRLNDPEMKRRVAELEETRDDLRRELEASESDGKTITPEEREKLQRDWKNLMQDTEELMREMEGQ